MDATETTAIEATEAMPGQSLGETLGLIPSLPSGERRPADAVERCVMCGELVGGATGPVGTVLRHRCCTCRDGGRIAQRTGLARTAYSPCPQCVGAASRDARLELDEDGFLRRSRIPLRFQGCSLKTWLPDNGNPRLTVQSWCVSWPPAKPTLTLMGERGNGKTHLACAVLRHAFEHHGVGGQFWTCEALYQRYRATYGEDATETEAGIDQLLMRVPLLVLDDLGAQHQTEWAESKLYAIVNARYNDAKPLVVTVNVLPSALGHPRIASRLCDVESSVTVTFRGPDYRLGGRP